jgi:hypothetical protein
MMQRPSEEPNVTTGGATVHPFVEAGSTENVTGLPEPPPVAVTV